MALKSNNITDYKYSNYYLKSLRTLVVFLLSYNSVFSQDKLIQETVSIPEPLMFDLVRGLGAKQGELEINSLADFPLNNGSNRGVEWAPEIEYALFDNFAIELEFPLNNFELEALKMAIQFWYNQNIEKPKIIALKGAYHGDTFGAMSAAERSPFSEAFNEYLFEVVNL